MSGLSRTPGKRVRVNSPPRVRIPPVPPLTRKATFGSLFLWLRIFEYSGLSADSLYAAEACSEWGADLFRRDQCHRLPQNSAALHTALHLPFSTDAGFTYSAFVPAKNVTALYRVLGGIGRIAETTTRGFLERITCLSLASGHILGRTATATRSQLLLVTLLGHGTHLLRSCRAD